MRGPAPSNGPAHLNSALPLDGLVEHESAEADGARRQQEAEGLLLEL